MTDGDAATSLLKEVISVRDDLLGGTFSLFVVSQASSWLMYCYKLTAAISYLGWWDMTVRSSAYDMRCVFWSMEDEMPCIQRLKKCG